MDIHFALLGKDNQVHVFRPATTTQLHVPEVTAGVAKGRVWAMLGACPLRFPSSSRPTMRLRGWARSFNPRGRRWNRLFRQCRWKWWFATTIPPMPPRKRHGLRGLGWCLSRTTKSPGRATPERVRPRESGWFFWMRIQSFVLRWLWRWGGSLPRAARAGEGRGCASTPAICAGGRPWCWASGMWCPGWAAWPPAHSFFAGGRTGKPWAGSMNAITLRKNWISAAV